jgi:hypothetical protein
MEALVLFTPEEPEGSWRVRVFPWPARSPIPGLNDGGEAGGLAVPDFAALDKRMLAVRAGYTKRLHPSGVMEVTASGRGEDALCEWVAELLKNDRLG